MKKIRSGFAACLLVGLASFGFSVQANAQPQMRRQQPSGGGSARNEREVRKILQNLNAKVDDFRYRMSYDAANGARANRTTDLSGDLRSLQDNLRAFEAKFNRRSENADDVRTLLAAARAANDSINRNHLNNRDESDWASIKTSFEQLAASYNVDWRESDSARSGDDDTIRPSDVDDDVDATDNRRRNGNRPTLDNSHGSGLTGTYRLDAARSENAGDVAERVIGGSNMGGNARANEDLRAKLEAPEQIAVDVRGNRVTLASSRAPQISFTADGRDGGGGAPQRTGSGAGVRLRSTLRGQELIVSRIGGGDEDYTVTFASIDDGKTLRVTRRITTAYLNETVFIESFYRKTDSVARLGISDGGSDSSDSYSSSDSDSVSDSDRNFPNDSGANNRPNDRPAAGRTGGFVVPSGAILTGTLQNDISTEYSQNNDRFRLNVTAPNEFRGAVIEGRISGLSRSGKVSGRSHLTFNFETIRLADGQTYDFAGFLQNVTDADGKTVKVDAEGTARGDDQTRETVKRGSIGAGVGAIIGAIAGGGKGAAIGAILGGGAGAGSVAVQGKDDLQLKAGSSITVQSSSPSR